MPNGVQGQMRPADVIGNAVMIAKIATGEFEETCYKQPAKFKTDRAGATACAKALSTKERSEFANGAAVGRWV